MNRTTPLAESVPYFFQTCAMYPDLRLVPGLTEHSIAVLNLNGLTTADQLVGLYFLGNRKQQAFEQLLVTYGIKSESAKKCVEAVHQKFGGV